MVNWFTQIYNKIVESNDQAYLDTINELNTELKTKDVVIDDLNIGLIALNKTNNILNIVNTEQSLQIQRLLPDPVELQGMSDYFEVNKTKYRFKPDKYDYLHKSLNNFSKDEDYVAKYFAFMQELGIKESYDSVDWVVYDVIIKVQKYINETLPDDYDTDLESFGHREYWLTPQEAFDYYVEDEDVGDCEDTSTFLYGAIMSVLVTYQYEDAMWRLLRTDINFPVGHAVCIWLKENHVWACIESTYGESRFYKNWINNKDMFKGVYTGIWNGHIFNEVTEYEEKN